ncbi:hypothetical protein CTA2_4346 [Colletotrichum tanaceti]|nr:hypothetical protein CTA2_4346 [Colletotrichum tanaceti]
MGPPRRQHCRGHEARQDDDAQHPRRREERADQGLAAEQQVRAGGQVPAAAGDGRRVRRLCHHSPVR